MSYINSDASFSLYIHGSIGFGMKFTSTTLSVNGTVMSSDKRLKFNQTPLTNAFDMLNKFEFV